MKNDGYFYKNKIFVMTQDFAFRKLMFIEKLTQLQDEDILLVLEQILKINQEEDWANDLTDTEKESIERGIQQLNEGKGETYETFQKRMEKKFK